jgi:hypothetical protein
MEAVYSSETLVSYFRNGVFRHTNISGLCGVETEKLAMGKYFETRYITRGNKNVSEISLLEMCKFYSALTYVTRGSN